MIDVVCALIEQEGKVLACQRSATMAHPMKWEFPGGKIKTDESAKQALLREIKEELRVEIIIDKALSPVAFAYPDKHIRLWPFTAKLVEGTIRLQEHQQYQWIAIEQLDQFDWLAADIPVYKAWQQLRSR